MRGLRMLELVALTLLIAAPAAAQTCIGVPPVRLAQNVIAARAFPRPLTSTQATQLRQLLPALRTEPGASATPLRGWVATGGFTAAERCPLTYALMRAVLIQSPPAGGSGSAGAATALAAIETLVAQLQGLQADLQALKAQLATATQNLQDLFANRPEAPGSQATAQATQAYQMVLSNWQAQVNAEQAEIASLQATIAAKQAEIDAKQKELERYQSALASAVDGVVRATIR